MPIYIDILENEVLGPAYKRGFDEGRQQGLLEGRQEGLLEIRQEGLRKAALAILRRLIQTRFGALPTWAGEQLTARSTPELQELCLRMLDAQSLEDLLK